MLRTSGASAFPFRKVRLSRGAKPGHLPLLTGTSTETRQTPNRPKSISVAPAVCTFATFFSIAIGLGV